MTLKNLSFFEQKMHLESSHEHLWQVAQLEGLSERREYMTQKPQENQPVEFTFGDEYASALKNSQQMQGIYLKWQKDKLNNDDINYELDSKGKPFSK